MIEMEVFENDAVLTFFGADHSLISSSVKAIHISLFEGNLAVAIDFGLLYSKDQKNFRIRLIDVIEYAFYHKNGYDFYNVVNLKFFAIGELYYLSLDPDESVKGRSDSDNDFVLCKKLQATRSE